MSIEASALRLGGTVAKLIAGAWLSRKKAEARRGAELSELIAYRFGGLRESDRRSLERKIDDLGDVVGDRLHDLIVDQFSDLPQSEVVSALSSTTDSIKESDLSDLAILRADSDPMKIAKDIRDNVDTTGRRHLSQSGRALFDLALDQVCMQLVYLIRELPEFEGRLAEEQLRRTTALLERSDQVLNRLPSTSLDAPRGASHDEEFRRRYLEQVVAHYDDLELIGVSVRNFRPRTSLSVAYLSLTVSQTSGRNQHKTLLADSWIEEEQYTELGSAVRVEYALGMSDTNLIRGEAGSGKSTLLRWLAVTSAREGFTYGLADWNGCVPVLIKLRSYVDHPLPQPDDFLNDPSGPTTGPVPEGWMHRQLDSGRGLLLVDGVDELSSRQRPKVRKWLRALINRYPKTRIVVTSRPAAAGVRWLTAESFASVDLEKMSPSDVREFIERWHSALMTAAENDRSFPFEWSEIQSYRRRLLSQLNAREHLRSLASNPLTCAMLCALHLDRGGDLPRDRKSLYETALEMLLDRRETARDIPAAQQVSLPYRSKLTLLQDLAYWLNVNGRSELDKEIALERIGKKLEGMPDAHVDAEVCLDYLLERSGVIREPVEGRVDFVHRTFQEFLAACETFDERHIGLLIEKASSDQWRETIIMVVGLLNRPDRADLMNGILDRADNVSGKKRRRLRLLAATCRESLHEVQTDLLDRLDQNIRALVPPRNLEESRSLATVGESILHQLPHETTALSARQAAACVSTAALVNGPLSLKILGKYACDPRTEVQEELIDSWSLYDPAEFASGILRDAPLHNGKVLVEDPRLLPHLHKLNNVKEVYVDLNRAPSPDEMKEISEAPSLRYLRLASSGSISIQGIEHQTDLRDISLVADEIDGLDRLKFLSNATDLFVNKWKGTLEGIEFLNGLPGLTRLRIGPIETDYLEPLSTLKNLEMLTIEGSELRKALSMIPEPSALQSLTVFVEKCDITTGFIGRMFPNLERLGLIVMPSAGASEDAVMSMIDDLTELRNVKQVSLSAATEGIINELSRMPKVEYVHIARTTQLDLSGLRSDNLTIRVLHGTEVQGSIPKGIKVQRPNATRSYTNLKNIRHRKYLL